MKHTAATTIFLPLAMGRNYLPDIQKISGRKVTAIHAVTGMRPLYGGTALGTPQGGISSSLNLTENGTDYFMQDANLLLFVPEVNRGISLPIGRTLSVMDCYVNVTDAELDGKTLVLVVWYEAAMYSSPRDTEPQYDSFDIPIGLGEKLTRQYLPDIRTLAGKSFSRIYLNYPPVTPGYQEGIVPDEADGLYLSLVKGSYAVLDNVPLPLLYQTGNYAPVELDDIIFDFESSYLTAAAGSAGRGTKCVNLVVEYK